ncbi:hydroxypyruvate isomerase [Roseospira visakhapatnamensis]|uniref:Hydroxypyruvate isomerase n=1 Tax=Roseospira visakhapatnamensis TaxID=390880 RepID=A0A7W6RF55_9PROT|nr:hydroxypyruvate isomerase [Roseospira visakhapatnamensis]MBB4267323.1 hydroxypyruvate isomerase [Roseospira visakhapatnamensis]
MPKFAANLSMLFTERPFLDRFGAAAEAGFKGVEFLFPYDFEAGQIADCLKTHGLRQALHNLPAGDWSAGERGIACLPDRVGEFQDGVGKAITYAKALGCPKVNCLAGKLPPDMDRTTARETLVANLRFAATELKKAGVMLVVEAINTADIPGFFLSNTTQTLGVLDEVGSDNVFYQYDIYHMQRMEGELAGTLKANIGRIGHIQLADNPGRHEPGTGEINYDFLLPYIDTLGYDGWIGCEYVPAEGLGWMQRFAA